MNNGVLTGVMAGMWIGVLAGVLTGVFTGNITSMHNFWNAIFTTMTPLGTTEKRSI